MTVSRRATLSFLGSMAGPITLRPGKPSLRRRLGLALALLLLLIGSAVISAWRVTQHSTGEARTLNQTASLRMDVWRIEALRLSGQTQQTEQSIEQYEQRITHLTELIGPDLLPSDGTLPRQIQLEWQNLRPRLSSAPVTTDLTPQLTHFTHQLNRLVQALAWDIEARIHTLRWFQGGVLIAALIITLGIIRHLQRDFFAPLTTLQKAANAVKNGQFSVRIPSRPANELGDLGEAFNTMVERLSALYSGLEDRVEEKTHELQQSNHLLQLLYRTATRLSEQDVTQEVLVAMLEDVEQALGLGPGIVCVRREEDGRAYPIATPLPEAERAALCDALGCTICFGSATPHSVQEYQVGQIQLVSVPLTVGGSWQGVMPFQIKNGHTLIPWQTQILQTLAGHVATALSNARRTEERHRLVVHEERAIIARELHDSLAQSLSYLKIQVALLQAQLNPQLSVESQTTLEELKSGLNSAYRELRALLTTFRLTPGGTPFTEELRAIVNEASRRCGFTIALTQHMNNLELNAQEEIHVTRMIRETLINIERHAAASWAQVIVAANGLRQVELTIEDNGQGWPATLPKEGHFGLDILRERAAQLNGTLTLDSGPHGGARITVSFLAQTPYALH